MSGADQVPVVDARDELLTLCKAALDAAQYAIGDGANILWQGDTTDRPADGTSHWARVGLLHSPASGKTVGVGAAEEDGPRLYHYFGQLCIQLFTPLGDGLSLADTVSNVLIKALRRGRTASNVTTKNAVAVEAGRDATWYQTNIYADFEYYDRG